MSEIELDILRAAEIIGAITVIIVAIRKIIKPLKELLKKIDTIDRHQRENYLMTLRLTICSEEIPLEERLAAGDKYVKLGGNGAVKHKYEELLKQLDEKE
ncbi:MAG: hypothetical protein IJE14_05815 [Clostridia bacterium]|nr:hypothetical protein [Clostridia bacterium]MBR4049194.1 hypothetical protein [Clostridia bacterium]